MQTTTIATAERFTLIECAASDEREDFALDVREGLTASPKHLSCRFFYDRRGSKLFEEICRLPEYYPTRTERWLLNRFADEVVSACRKNGTLVELGSGSSAKTRVLIDAFLAARSRLTYVPIDVSREMLAQSAEALIDSFDGLDVTAFVGDYVEGLRYVSHAIAGPKCILWLGSSIGNFDRASARHYLRMIAATMGPDDRLILGIDVRKDKAVLEAAYDDATGVTAEFNLNLLARINRELDGDFNLDRFAHRAVYREGKGRVDIYAVSRNAQQVHVGDLDLTVSFHPDEAIHTESSYKYSLAEIEDLATGSGMSVRKSWLDPKQWFSLSLLAIRPE